jgi:hypothetical protein
MGIGDILRVETRERNDDRVRIGIHRNLIRFADINEKIATLGYSLRYVFRRQIVNAMTLIRHSNPPNDKLGANAFGKSGTDGSPFRANVASGVTKIKR